MWRRRRRLSIPRSAWGGLADFARQYPNDWEQRLNPTVRRMVPVQRAIGTRGVVVGFGEGGGGSAVTVAYTDGTDLSAAGLPRTLDGRPLTVTYGGPAVPAVGGLESTPRSPTPAGCPEPKAAPPAGPTRLPTTGSLPLAGLAALGAALVTAGAACRVTSTPK